MVFSKSLADRVRQVVKGRRNIVEKRMFGGLVFLLNGKMLVGIWETSLIARLGIEQAKMALKKANVSQFEVADRPMKGWVMVDPDGLESDLQLADWVELATEFVSTLPGK